MSAKEFDAEIDAMAQLIMRSINHTKAWIFIGFDETGHPATLSNLAPEALHRILGAMADGADQIACTEELKLEKGN